MYNGTMYISHYTNSDGKERWSLIDKAAPMCAEQDSREAVIDIAKSYTTFSSELRTWDGNKGEFEPTRLKIAGLRVGDFVVGVSLRHNMRHSDDPIQNEVVLQVYKITKHAKPRYVVTLPGVAESKGEYTVGYMEDDYVAGGYGKRGNYYSHIRTFELNETPEDVAKRQQGRADAEVTKYDAAKAAKALRNTQCLEANAGVIVTCSITSLGTMFTLDAVTDEKGNKYVMSFYTLERANANWWDEDGNLVKLDKAFEVDSVFYIANRYGKTEVGRMSFSEKAINVEELIKGIKLAAW